jgi:hypothetical protein
VLNTLWDIHSTLVVPIVGYKPSLRLFVMQIACTIGGWWSSIHPYPGSWSGSILERFQGPGASSFRGGQDAKETGRFLCGETYSKLHHSYYRLHEDEITSLLE